MAANNTRDIKRRISSVKNTQQITKAMKMVSAAKLRKAERMIKQARPYSNRLEEVIFNLAWKINRDRIPLLAERPLEKIALCVVTSDRGFCGGFNANIIKRAVKYINDNQDKKISLILIGKKAINFFKKQNLEIIAQYQDFSNELDFSHAVKIGDLVMNRYIEKNLDGVILVYNEFKNAIMQDIIVKQLLPVNPDEFAVQEEINKNMFTYEPSKESVLNDLIPQYFHVAVWRILLESNASEHGARMTAMDSATNNADDLIHTLTLSYNRARQAGITKEIIEIASGSEALKNSGGN